MEITAQPLTGVEISHFTEGNFTHVIHHERPSRSCRGPLFTTAVGGPETGARLSDSVQVNVATEDLPFVLSGLIEASRGD